MSELMRPMPFAKLMSWTLDEYSRQQRIFGIDKAKFYKNNKGTAISIFGDTISSPIGPAAGPNSQLAQNIIAAYLTGSRCLELTTVHRMDGAELRACVHRPCINAVDECHNGE